jgi:hypothetical protein
MVPSAGKATGTLYPTGNPNKPIRLRRSLVTRYGIRAPRLSLLWCDVNLNLQTVNKLVGFRTHGVLIMDSRSGSVNKATSGSLNASQSIEMIKKWRNN